MHASAETRKAFEYWVEEDPSFQRFIDTGELGMTFTADGKEWNVDLLLLSLAGPVGDYKGCTDQMPRSLIDTLWDALQIDEGSEIKPCTYGEAANALFVENALGRVATQRWPGEKTPPSLESADKFEVWLAKELHRRGALTPDGKWK